MIPATTSRRTRFLIICNPAAVHSSFCAWRADLVFSKIIITLFGNYATNTIRIQVTGTIFYGTSFQNSTLAFLNQAQQEFVIHHKIIVDITLVVLYMNIYFLAQN